MTRPHHSSPRVVRCGNCFSLGTNRALLKDTVTPCHDQAEHNPESHCSSNIQPPQRTFATGTSEHDFSFSTMDRATYLEYTKLVCARRMTEAAERFYADDIEVIENGVMYNN